EGLSDPEDPSHLEGRPSDCDARFSVQNALLERAAAARAAAVPKAYFKAVDSLCTATLLRVAEQLAHLPRSVARRSRAQRSEREPAEITATWRASARAGTQSP